MFDLIMNDAKIDIELDDEKNVYEFMQGLVTQMAEKKLFIYDLVIDGTLYQSNDEKLKTLAVDDVKEINVKVQTPRDMVMFNIMINESLNTDFKKKINDIITRFNKDDPVYDTIIKLFDDYSVYLKMLKNTAEIISIEKFEMDDVVDEFVGYISKNNKLMLDMKSAVKNEDYQLLIDILKFELSENLEELNTNISKYKDTYFHEEVKSLSDERLH